MLSKLLGKFKISLKISIIPALLILFMVAQGIIVLGILNEQSQTSIELKEGAFAKKATVEKLVQSATEINASIYQIYTLHTLSSVNLDQAKGFIDKIKTNQEELKKDFEILEALPSNDAEKEIMTAAKEFSANYEAALKDVLSMIEFDVSVAFMYQNGANLAFAGMEEKLSILKKNADTAILSSFDNAISQAKTAKDQFVSILLTALTLGLIVSWVMTKAITNPISGLTKIMDILASGNTSIEVPAKENRDEIGEMARAVEVFRQNAIRAKELEERQKQAEKQTEAEKKALMAKLADDFEASVMGVVDTVSRAARSLDETAQSMSAISEETSRQAMAAASASQQASANVSMVAAASEEMSNSIEEISRQVAVASHVSREAVDKVHATNQVVSGLAESAKRISEVLSLITDIANQTNLLALNATIEAARAGDAGKGFAVVAGEVKNLASQTARATDEIGQQINDVQSKTDEAVNAIQIIGEVINKIDEASSAIASAVEEQSATTREISRNVEQAAAGTNEVAANINGVTHAADEARQASAHVLEAAKTLADDANTLRGEVESFISKIRAS